MHLAGKVAIVTAGASGIGRATAGLFAREGARVAIADIDAERGERAAAEILAGGGEARAVATDVGKPDDVARLVEETVDAFGTVDVLFSNAAYLDDFRPALDTTDEGWERALALPHLTERGGAIVFTSSVGALEGFCGYAAYCAAKAGLIGLARSLALDYGARGVRVNVVCPGAIDTPVMAAARERPEVLRRVNEKSVLGRMGTADEVARAVLFLASDEASFITGAVLTVDGGWTLG